MQTSPAAGRCGTYRCMYICERSRSVGAGSATTRNTRGLTRSVIALIVPPLPAPSRPSKTTQTLSPLCLTHSCSLTSSTCSFANCFSYAFRFSLPLCLALLSFDALPVSAIIASPWTCSAQDAGPGVPGPRPRTRRNQDQAPRCLLLTRNWASERASEALTVATSSSEI